MLLMLVFVGAMVSRDVLMVMPFFPCIVTMFVRMLMAVGVFMLVDVLMFMGFLTVRVLMFMVMPMLVFVLVLVRMFAFHGSLLLAWNDLAPMNFSSNEQAIKLCSINFCMPNRNGYYVQEHIFLINFLLALSTTVALRTRT